VLWALLVNLSPSDKYLEVEYWRGTLTTPKTKEKDENKFQIHSG